MNTIDPNKYLILFENCQLCKGYKRASLIDFQRRNLEFIDNEICDIINNKSREYNIGEILNYYPVDQQNIILDYITFLIDKEYAFLCERNEVDYFPKISLEYQNPAIITNCIIDFKTEKKLIYYKNVVSDLDTLGCENVQIRFFNIVDNTYVLDILNLFANSNIYRIELLLKYSGEKIYYYKNLLKKIPIIKEIIVHSNTKDYNKTQNHQTLIFTRKKIDDENYCGITNPSYFNLRIEHYIESQQFNTCLNRKVCIDADGNIKNCPAMRTAFGNIESNRIIDALNIPEFKKNWNVCKDKIEVCKDCEFRHICTDCRAFLDNDYSLEKTKKCTYNPYF